MFKKSLFLTAALCLTGLTACENTKEQLGLARKMPDEYAITKRAPLEMPPDYALRPPQPGAPRPQESAPAAEAQEAVFGGRVAGQTNPESGESALLMQAGAGNTPPDIRQRVDYETSVLEPKQKPVAEKLLGWAGARDEQPPATVVDPKAEAERLKKNEEEGKPVTEGETPVIKE